jgi:hypothetical protein
MWNDEALPSRVELLIDVAFGGNQLRAANALGISQPSISKVIAGTRPPNQTLIERLAAYPGVNPRYLYHGEGQPLMPSTTGTLPVGHIVLPGLPGEHQDLLAGDRHPVAPSLDRESRYWLRLGAGSPIVTELQPRFLVNDLLLVECDRDRLDRLDGVHGQLCAVRVRWDAEDDYRLARVLVDGKVIQSRLFGLHGSSGTSATGDRGGISTVYANRPSRKIGHRKGNPRTKKGVKRKTRPSSTGPDPADVFHELPGLHDIVGVVLMQERLPALV